MHCSIERMYLVNPVNIPKNVFLSIYKQFLEFSVGKKIEKFEITSYFIIELPSDDYCVTFTISRYNTKKHKRYLLVNTFTEEPMHCRDSMGLSYYYTNSFKKCRPVIHRE